MQPGGVVVVTASFSDSIIFAVHTRKTAFSNSTVFKLFHSGERFRNDPFSDRCSVDSSRIRNKTVSFSFENGVVWTGSTLQRSENGSFRKRSPEWNDLKTVLFENAVFLAWTAKTILSENDDVTTATPSTTQPCVYKIADRRFLMVSLLIVVIFSLLTLLEAHLTLLRQLFDFSRR